MNVMDRLMREVERLIAKGKRIVPQTRRQNRKSVYVAREYHQPPVTFPDPSRLTETFAGMASPRPVEPASVTAAASSSPTESYLMTSEPGRLDDAPRLTDTVSSPASGVPA